MKPFTMNGWRIISWGNYGKCNDPWELWFYTLMIPEGCWVGAAPRGPSDLLQCALVAALCNRMRKEALSIDAYQSIWKVEEHQE
jgi:hypothetical protein